MLSSPTPVQRPYILPTDSIGLTGVFLLDDMSCNHTSCCMYTHHSFPNIFWLHRFCIALCSIAL